MMKSSELLWHPRTLLAPLNYIIAMTTRHRPALMEDIMDEAACLNVWCEHNGVNSARQILVFSVMLKVAMEEQIKKRGVI